MSARVAVDLRSPNEETVLHLAARRGSREVTERLLAHPGVDPWLKSGLGGELRSVFKPAECAVFVGSILKFRVPNVLPKSCILNHELALGLRTSMPCLQRTAVHCGPALTESDSPTARQLICDVFRGWKLQVPALLRPGSL